MTIDPKARAAAVATVRGRLRMAFGICPDRADPVARQIVDDITAHLTSQETPGHADDPHRRHATPVDESDGR